MSISWGGEQLLVHHFLYTFINTYVYIDITIIVFIFSILVNSFISTYEFYFFFFPFFFLFFFPSVSPISHWEGVGTSKGLYGAQPPVGLNHKLPFC